MGKKWDKIEGTSTAPGNVENLSSSLRFFFRFVRSAPGPSSAGRLQRNLDAGLFFLSSSAWPYFH